MSDPAVTPENTGPFERPDRAELLDHLFAAGELTPAIEDSAGVVNGHAVDRNVVERLLQPVAAPVPKRAALRRWVPGVLLLDVALLAVANLLFLADAGQLFSWPSLLAFDAAAIALLATWRGYAPRLRLDVLDDVRMAVASTAVATLFVVSLDSLARATEPSAYGALRLWLLASMLLTAGRATWNVTTSWRRRTTTHAAGATTIVVGAGQVGRLTASRLLEHPEFGLHPIGFLDSDPIDVIDKPLQLPVLGTTVNLEQVVAARDVECAVVAFSTDSHDALLTLIDECDRLGVRALVVPRLFERVPARLQVTHVGGLPLLEMLSTNPRSIQFAVKYALDRVVSLVLLVALAPLLAVIAAAVAASLGRPLLYRQERVSLDERRFKMLKFRTMEDPLDEPHPVKEFDPKLAPGGVEGEDRRTRVGAFLRRWSLDELPQLANVLRGEMSLVGPRPERPDYVEFFRKHIRRYDSRLRTKAGITGWAQIHQFRGKTSIADRVEWDNYYIENFSLWLDLKILLRTIPETLRGRAN